MSSIWLKNANTKSYPALNSNLMVDVCILGGGLTGLSCAYYLCKHNLKTCILEKDSIMQKTSGHTTAKITSAHGLIYQYLYDSYGRDTAIQYLQSNEEAITNIKNIIDVENIDCDFEFQNHYIYTTQPNCISKIKKEVQILEKINFKSKMLDHIELPLSNVKTALEYPHQAQFNPIQYANGLCEFITNHAGQIFEHSQVVKLEKFGKNYRIITKQNMVTAKYVIIATRYPIINFPGFHFLKMYSETSYLLAAETNQPLFNGMYISEDDEHYSFRTATLKGKKFLLVGGLHHKTGEKIDVKNRYSLLKQKAMELYPNAKILYTWNTQDAISLDKIPYIGDFSLFYPNVYVATGFKKWGMTTSHVAATIITDKILNKINPYSEIYTATRFRPIKNRKELKNMFKQTAQSLVINKFHLPITTYNHVQPGEGKIINDHGKKIGLYKDEDGREYKIIPTCTHLGCELTFNSLDKTWDCPCHGSRYTFDGTLLYGPSKKNLKMI